MHSINIFTILFFIFVLGFIFVNSGKNTFTNTRINYSRLVRRVFILFLYFYFVLLYCCRKPNIGTDTFVYLSVFSNISKNMTSFSDNLNSNLERGYVNLVYIISKITHNRTLFLFFIASIIYGNILYCINKFCRNNYSIFIVSLFFILSQFFFETTNLMRQMIAVSIILNAYYFLYKRKYILYFSIIFLCYYFHKSSIICLFVPFLRLFKLNKKTIKFYFCILLFLTFFGVKFLYVIIQILFPEYAGYFVNSSAYGIAPIGFKLGSLLNLIIQLCFVLYYHKNIDYNNELLCFYFRIYLIGTLCTACSVMFAPFVRLAFYFTSSFIPISSLLSYRRKDLLVLLLVLLMYCFTVCFLRPQWTGFFPYSPIF